MDCNSDKNTHTSKTRLAYHNSLVPEKYQRIVDIEALSTCSKKAIRCFLLHLLYDHPDKPTGTWVAPEVARKFGISPSQKCRAMKELMINGVMYILEPGHTGYTAVYGINRPTSGVTLTIQKIQNLLERSTITVDDIRAISKKRNNLRNSIDVDLHYVRSIHGIKELNPGKLFVCRCPFCGDSKKSTNKMRGYFFPSTQNDTLMFKCHNCQITGPFGMVMKHLGMSKKWAADLFDRDNSGKTIVKGNTTPRTGSHSRKSRSRAGTHRKSRVRLSMRRVISVFMATAIPLFKELPDHPGRQYVESRGVGISALHRFWYTEDAGEIANAFGVSMYIPKGPRICWYLRNGLSQVSAIMTRSLSNKDYRMIKLRDSAAHMFWTGAIDERRLVHIVEGTFDAIALPNSIAVNGADLMKVGEGLRSVGYKVVLCWDNEIHTNPIIAKLWKEALRSGFWVLEWKPDCPFKDLSEMYAETGRTAWVKPIYARNLELAMI